MSFATSSEMVYLCKKKKPRSFSNDGNNLFTDRSNVLATLGHLLILGITVVIRTFLSTTVKSDEISELTVFPQLCNLIKRVFK